MKTISKIAFFGDIMLSRNIATQWENLMDPCKIFDHLDNFFGHGIKKIGNFENPSTGMHSINEGHLRLNAPTEFLPCINERFDLVSLANNHILD